MESSKQSIAENSWASQYLKTIRAPVYPPDPYSDAGWMWEWNPNLGPFDTDLNQCSYYATGECIDPFAIRNSKLDQWRRKTNTDNEFLILEESDDWEGGNRGDRKVPNNEGSLPYIARWVRHTLGSDYKVYAPTGRSTVVPGASGQDKKFVLNATLPRKGYSAWHPFTIMHRFILHMAAKFPDILKETVKKVKEIDEERVKNGQPPIDKQSQILHIMVDQYLQGSNNEKPDLLVVVYSPEAYFGTAKEDKDFTVAKKEMFDLFASLFEIRIGIKRNKKNRGILRVLFVGTGAEELARKYTGNCHTGLDDLGDCSAEANEIPGLIHELPHIYTEKELAEDLCVRNAAPLKMI